MKRAWLVVFLFACASKESPPPQNGAPPPPSASAAASTGNMWGDSLGEGSIGLGNLPSDAGGNRAPVDHPVNGRIAPEIVQRIVRASFDRTKACYERALKKTPSLTGRVTTRFVIDEGGKVSSAAPEASGTTLADAQAVDCVVGVFKTLEFPKPQGGIVTIVYPLVFSPSDD
jgi:hypothetical protein